MKLDLSAAWDGAMKMLGANREMVLVLAGVGTLVGPEAADFGVL